MNTRRTPATVPSRGKQEGVLVPRSGCGKNRAASAEKENLSLRPTSLQQNNRNRGQKGRGDRDSLYLRLISRGCWGIKRIPYNSIREASIKAAALMCTNTTCVRNRHRPLIKASQLGRAAASRHSRSPNRGGVCWICGGGAYPSRRCETAEAWSLLTLLVWVCIYDHRLHVPLS